MEKVPNRTRPHRGLRKEYLWPLETQHNAALFRELQLIVIAFHWVQSTTDQDAGIIKENTSN